MRPLTIPALREWRPASGTFELGSPARIVVAPRDAKALSPVAEVLAEDLRFLLGIPVRVLVAGAAKTGDVRLRLGADDPVVGDEGYRLVLDEAAVITANTAAGAFYGTRSLLQLVVQPEPVPAGVALDWPRYAERGLLLDIGRKHLTIEWLAERVRELAFLKLNVLHLHFTDDLGWRIESERGIHSDEHLTKSEVRDLIELAARHHVRVVPEIDLPGHLGAALEKYPEFQLRDVFGRVDAGKLDYTIDGATALVRDLIEEYLPLFPGPYWHTGADEFLSPPELSLHPQLERYAQQRYGADATAKDGVLGLVNEVNALVKGHGKRLRVWHDGLGGGRAVTLDEDIGVEWWSDFSPLSDVTKLPTPREVLDAGHRITNCGWYPTYYSNLSSPLPPKPDLKGMYETWAAHRFRGALYVDGNVGSPYHDVDPAEPHNIGSRLSVWNDDPEAETEDQIAAAIYARLRVMAQQTWESPKLVPTYAEFERVIKRVGGPRGLGAARVVS